MSKHVPIVIVQGAQWGSEAKGAVAAFLCQKRNIALAVRTGAVNAGHTVYWPDANPDGIGCKMQQLPVGWVNPTTKLVLGAGTFIHPEILADEINWVSKWTGEDIRERLYIDHRASLHLPAHQDQAKVMDRHHLIGATGKGCSVAITDKITNRGRGYKLFKEWLDSTGGMPTLSWPGTLERLQFVDTQEMIHAAYDDGQSIQLEGTQGSLLDLHLGPYPYTTHKQTSAANWVTECGLAPGMEYETILVARTYPIRVAGNSGPMPQETTWTNLAREINRKLMNRRFPQRVKSYAIQDFETALHELANSGKFLLPKHRDGSPNFDMHLWTGEERVTYSHALSELNAATLSQLSGPVLSELMNLFELTTVTKKLRRIAQWDPATVARQCKYNRADSVVLTFFNYWYPEAWNITASKFEWLPEYKRRVKVLEDEVGCKVSYITTGPGSEHIIPTLR